MATLPGRDAVGAGRTFATLELDHLPILARPLRVAVVADDALLRLLRVGVRRRLRRRGHHGVGIVGRHAVVGSLRRRWHHGVGIVGRRTVVGSLRRR